MIPTVILRCQTVIDGELGWVHLPVSPELLDDAPVRAWAEDRARKELWHASMKRTGRDLPREDFADLPVWVEDPMTTRAELNGGPCDGENLTLPGTPPPRIDVPVDSGLGALLGDAEASAPTPLRRIAYEPLIDSHGHRARTPDGAWRYQASVLRGVAGHE